MVFNTNPQNLNIPGKFGATGQFLELSVDDIGKVTFGADINEVASLAASGEVDVEDGLLNVSDDLLLSGSGTLSLALDDQDLVMPKVTVGGDFRLDADAKVVIEAADDLAAGSYQLFAVDGEY